MSKQQHCLQQHISCYAGPVSVRHEYAQYPSVQLAWLKYGPQLSNSCLATAV
jgi:hypothetical protein